MKALHIAWLVAGCLLTLTGCTLDLKKMRTEDDIVGQVADRVTGNPISGARVRKRGGHSGEAFSSVDGRFHIAGRRAWKLVVANPATTYDYPNTRPNKNAYLEVTCGGYETEQKSLYGRYGQYRFFDRPDLETILMTPRNQ